jgi:hypothetical protein
MAVEVLAGAVVAHGRSRVGVTGGDLHVAEADAGIEHGGDECVAQHVWVHSRHPYARGSSQVSQSPGRGVAIHSTAGAVQQDRPVETVADGSVNRPAYRWR